MVLRDLTAEEKQEIVEFCKKNEDLPFEHTARHFSSKFNTLISKDKVYGLYMDRLVGAG